MDSSYFFVADSHEEVRCFCDNKNYTTAWLDQGNKESLREMSPGKIVVFFILVSLQIKRVMVCESMRDFWKKKEQRKGVDWSFISCYEI